MITRYEGTGRMSRVVEHNNTLYLCGQVGSGGLDIKTQTSEVLKKIDDLLTKYNSDRNHLLSVTIYLRDMKDFSEMNEVWDNWVIEGFEPARACVEARLARETLLVEMSVIAARKEQKKLFRDVKNKRMQYPKTAITHSHIDLKYLTFDYII